MGAVGMSVGGMRGFVLVWLGQLVSLLGTGMTTFGIAIWAWQETGQATALALVAFFSFAPTVLLSPTAGALVDRWDRKTVMLLSDLGAGVATIVLLLLFQSGQLEIWHLYVTGALAGAFQAFQFPAYAAAITMMVPKEQFARANGMFSLAQSASGVAAPLLGGFLVAAIGLGGLLTIDIITFLFAVTTLLLVHIPSPKQSAEGESGTGSLWTESLYGFRYILARRPLLLLQLLFTALNLVGMFSFILLQPMILARSGNDAALLGTVMGIGGLGGIAGGLLMSTWGGPRRRIYGVLGGIALWSLLGLTLLGIGQSLIVWAIGFAIGTFSLPILNGSNQAIWQAKVAPDVQGRVFAVRRLIAQISAPIAMLLVGPLADRLFEPAMQAGGALVPLFGPLVGSGPGAGMSLMVLLSAAAGTLIAVTGFLTPSIRNIEQLMEDRVPDHDLDPDPAAGPQLETASS